MSERVRAYVDLAIALSWREVVVRYKRSVFGLFWALLDPAFQVVVYLGIFGVVLDAGRGIDSYPLFTAMGVLPWLFFSMSVDQGAPVLVEHYMLIRKLAFPHELLVLSVLVSRLTSLFVGIVVVLALAVPSHFLGLTTLWWGGLPLLALGTLALVALTAGITLVTSALQVVFADVHFLVRFALRIGFYACPIVYPLTRVPEAARVAYELNPLVAIIWCYQSFLGASVPRPGALAFVAAGVGSLLSLVVGWIIFRRLRGTVAELV